MTRLRPSDRRSLRLDRRRILAAGAVAAFASAAPAAFAQAGGVAGLTEGKEYRLVKPAQQTDAGPGKIEVLEFFWYGCPHCNTLEPLFNAWAAKQPADVVVRRVHVPFGDRRHQQLFYTLEAMGKADEMAPYVFRAIHVDRDRMDTPDRMIAVLSKHGLDEKQFRDVFNSFSVRTRMQRASQIVDAYGVNGVPAMAVNGKYFTAPSMVGSADGSLKVLDALIAAERKPA